MEGKNLSVEECAEARNQYDQIQVLDHLRELIILHRAGAVIFADSMLSKICHDHIFSRYPNELFSVLDAAWSAQLRKVLGPGSSVTVPPILACVLSRATKRSSLPLIIRDMRAEYDASRKDLWDHLQCMWYAPTLKSQLRELQKLENAGSSLFKAAFPERIPFLQTSLSVVTKVADLRPLGAIEEIGKAALAMDTDMSRVAGIAFTRQLTGDLRRIVGHSRLFTLLTDSERKVLICSGDRTEAVQHVCS